MSVSATSADMQLRHSSSFVKREAQGEMSVSVSSHARYASR